MLAKVIDATVKVLKHVQQNFRIFWVSMHFRGNVDDILWTAIKSVIPQHVYVSMYVCMVFKT